MAKKLTQKIVILTSACRLTVTGLLFVFEVKGAGIKRATYLCLDSKKNMDIKFLIIIHYMNFDHVWAEHYCETLIKATP